MIYTLTLNPTIDHTLTIGGFTLSNYYSVIVIVAALGIVITAAYVLRVVSQVFFGEFDEEKYPDIHDIALTDRVVLVLLGAPLIIVGMLPWLMAPMIESGVQPVFRMLGG